MIDLVLLVASIAVVDSLNPTTIVPALYLATGTRPVRSVLGFSAGVFVVNLVGGVIALGVGNKIADLVPKPSASLVHWGEVVLGGVALTGAGILWHRRHAVHGAVTRAELGVHRMAPLAGATIAAVELPTAFPYFAVIAAVAASSETVAVQVALLVLFNVLFLAPVIAIAGVRAVAGSRADPVFTRSRSTVLQHAGALAAGLVGLLGTVLLVLGLIGLT